MKRKLIKRYDSVNDQYTAHFIKEYADSIYVQSFKTPIFVQRCGYIGNKRKVGKGIWLGKGFLTDVLNSITL